MRETEVGSCTTYHGSLSGAETNGGLAHLARRFGKSSDLRDACPIVLDDVRRIDLGGRALLPSSCLCGCIADNQAARRLISARLRPSRLAWYSALSAACIKVEPSRAMAFVQVAMPNDMLVGPSVVPFL